MNVLLITADDMNWDAVTAMGAAGLPLTPHIDALAGQGAIFRRAHVTAAICQPSRQAMMTGRYPHNSGAPGFHPIAPDVPTLQESLRRAGYLNGILGKVEHLAPPEKFCWDYAVDRVDLAQGRDPSLYGQHARAFLARAAGEDRPFFLMANAHDPHRPFHGSAQERENHQTADILDRLPAPSRIFGPDEITVPGFLPDLPEVRTELAQYASSCRRCDDTVGEVLAALDASGLADETIVVFLSDNGMAFPFAKTNCYLHSTRTPWIVRWAGVVEAGRVDDEHFINGIDLAPTLLDALGLPPLAGIDGRSFLPVLSDAAAAGRDHLVTHINTIAGGRAYPMRAVHHGQFGYIFNAWADGQIPFRNESMSGLTWPAMATAAQTDPAVADRARLFRFRVPEELYDFTADPHALHNLIAEPAHADTLSHLRALLLAEMHRSQDPQLDAFTAHGASCRRGPRRV